MKHEPQHALRESKDRPPQHDPFLQRILAFIERWIEEEWEHKEAIRAEALAEGWTTARATRLRDAILTPHRLAAAMDGMSETTLRRELEKLSSPPPGELIRKARIRHAAKLLTHTRLLVHRVARRAGYKNEKHFTDAFRAEFQTTPSEYRRRFIHGDTDT